jgi:hypothetical protein
VGAGEVEVGQGPAEGEVKCVDEVLPSRVKSVVDSKSSS